MMKANSVPMFTRFTISAMFARAENAHTTAPVRIVETAGVPKRGLTFANNGGRSPSRDIDIKMRGCPSWNTRRTAVIDAVAPRDTTVFAQTFPVAATAVFSGSAPRIRSSTGTSAVATKPMAM